MNYTNYHSHTPYCDGRCNIEEFIATAIFWGFTSYGVSPHSPIQYKSSCNMNPDRVNDYITEMEYLKNKYRGKIELYTGMEIDFFGEDWNCSIPYFQNLPLDYRIAAIHFLPDKSGNFIDIDCNSARFKQIVDTRFEGDIEYVVKTYFNRMQTMIKTGGFDFVAHPDKISMNASAYSPNICKTEWYKDIMYDYIHFIAKQGTILEVNTKAFKSKGFIFPNIEHFKFIHSLNIPLVINSDAHLPSLIKSGFDEARQFLAAAGYTHTMQLAGGKWQKNYL